jgi:hypothetical protein
LRSLISELSEQSEEFRDTWNRWEVRRFMADVRVIRHPTPLQLDVSQDATIRVVVQMLDDQGSRDRLGAWLAESRKPARVIETLSS